MTDLSLRDAVAQGDVAAVISSMALASSAQRQEALAAAVHWGDAPCVQALLPHCDLAAVMAFAEARELVEPEGLRTQPEVQAVLLGAAFESQGVVPTSARSRL